LGPRGRECGRNRKLPTNCDRRLQCDAGGLAREAGLGARFQDVPVLAQWRVSGTTFIVERHVNAPLRIESRDFVVDFEPPAAATYSRARVIHDANARARAQCNQEYR